MAQIKAFNDYSNEVFKLYFKDGKLVRNYSYHYVTLKTLYDEYRVPEEGQDSICVEHFNRAIRNVCIQDRDVDFEELLFCLRNDQEYFDIAKKIISNETEKMSKRIDLIGCSNSTNEIIFLFLTFLFLFVFLNQIFLTFPIFGDSQFNKNSSDIISLLKN